MNHLRESIVHAAGGVKRLLLRISTSRSAIVTVVAAIFVFAPLAAHAQGLSFGDGVVVLIGEVVEFFVQLLGKLLVAVIDILIQVAQYNGFADSAAVNIGWVVARDIANMFFIIGLVVISFGTILQWEQYRYNRLLGKLVITAVIVNFSKAITLFMIDFSQVIMLTFVNAFRDVAAGNLTTGFGIRALLTYANSATSVDINIEETVMIYALAVILILVALIVTLSLIVILVRRIISLWIIIILAPLAFVASVMPGGLGGYNSGWWKRLGSEMFIGPTLAFFLWLSFSVIFLTSGGNSSSTAEVIQISENGQIIQGSQEQLQAVISEIGSTKNIFNFVATIVLLIHSMTIAQQAGGFAGKFAGRMSGMIDRGGAALAKGIVKAPKKLSDWTGTTGAVKRVGFDLADAALGVGERAKLPFGWNNKLGIARGRLSRRRDREADEAMKDISNMSKETLLRMAEGRPIDEKGRARQKVALQRLIDQGDADDLSPEARMKYRNYIGYQETAVPEKDANGNPLLDEHGQVKYKLKRTATDQDGYSRLKKLTKEHMEYWLDGYDLKDDKLKSATMGKFKSEIDKLRRNTWTNLDPDSVKQSTATNVEGPQAIWQGWREQFGDEEKDWPTWFREFDKTKKDFLRGAAPASMATWGNLPTGGAKPVPNEIRQQYEEWESRRHFNREFEARQRLGIEDPALNPQDAANFARQSQRLIIQPTTDWQREIQRRLNAAPNDEAKNKIVDEYQQFAQSQKLTSAQYAAMFARRQAGGASPLADASPEARKQYEEEQKRREDVGLTGSVTPDQMREAAQAYTQNSLQDLPPEVQQAFMSQVAKNKSADQIVSDIESYQRASAYASEDEYQESKRIFDALSREQGEAPEFVAGRDAIKRLEAEQKRAVEQGREAVARFAADFEKLNLDSNYAGINLTGAQKEQMIPKLQEMFRRMLEQEGELSEEQIAEQVAQFGQQLNQAESIAIANTKREGFTLGHVIRHENAHNEIDKLSDQDVQEIFNQMTEQEREAILSRVQERWDFSGLSDDERQTEAMKEYLTEGLANYGRSDAVGEQLNPDLAFALKSKGVRFRSYANVPEAPQSATPTREELETSRRAQEQKVIQTQQSQESRMNEISSELPQGVTPQQLQNTNPLVEKDLREKGVSDTLFEEVRRMNYQLRSEQKTLRDIETQIARQSSQEERRSKDIESTLRTGFEKASSAETKTVPKESPKKPEKNQGNQANSPASGTQAAPAKPPQEKEIPPPGQSI